MKKILRGGTIATSQGVLKGDILIEGERIARIGGEIADVESEVIDVTGNYILPGGIDPHTHFDLDVGFTRASDNFLTGSIAAACGGTTTIIDHMAFGPKGCTLRSRVDEYHKLAGPAVIDYGFHGVVQYVDDKILQEMGELLEDEGIQSYKVYLTYDDMLSDHDVLAVLQKAKELNLVVCAHCENDGSLKLLKEQALAQGHLSTKYHPLTRPSACEAEAVYRFCMLGAMAGDANVYVVHLTTERGLYAIREARRHGQFNILAETCPQYLLLDDSLYNDPENGLKAMMCPPLRKKADQQALWQGLESEEIDTIGTDHCPFFFSTQKQRGKDNFLLAPNGAPGVELRIPLLFSEGFMKKRLELETIVKACCTRPAEIFGIASRKGDIAVGMDADIVVMDPEVKWTAGVDQLHENVDYTLYEGIELEGKPVMTISRGEVIVKNGEFIGKEGRGNYLRREPFQN